MCREKIWNNIHQTSHSGFFWGMELGRVLLSIFYYFYTPSNSSFFFFNFLIFFYFLNFKIFNSYMRSQT